MRFGVLILPDASWSAARERWQSAERLGFDHAWTYDHLTWRSLRERVAAEFTLTHRDTVSESETFW